MFDDFVAEAEVSAFVSSLTARVVSVSTQNQALSAVLFLYEVVAGRRLPWVEHVVRAQRPVRLPVVLSRGEVAALMNPLLGHLAHVKAQHEADLSAGRGAVALPWALRLKYPNAPREWAWQLCSRRRGCAAIPGGGRHPDIACTSRPFSGR